MSGFKPNKPRKPGTLHAALTRAIDQAGSMDLAADAIGRPRSWLYAASDPDLPPEKEAKLSYAEARMLSRVGGVTALAEDMAALAGGAFLPGLFIGGQEALQSSLATYTKESGEALSVIIQRASDGDFTRRDAEAALPEIDDALRALMAVRARVVEVLS